MATESEFTKTFVATEALEQFRRVKFTSASRTAVEYADAGEDFIGITMEKVAISEPVSVKQWGNWATFKCIAAGAVTLGAAVYGAADGKVDDTASGPKIGEAETAATADAQEIEIRPQAEGVSEYSQLNDVNGAEALILGATSTAVNEVTMTNAATGGAPAIEASGDDTNISLEIGAKGAGVVQLSAPVVEKMTQTALTDTATVTIAQMLTKVLDGTPTAAATYTLPTAALLVAGIADAKHERDMCANRGAMTACQKLLEQFVPDLERLIAVAEAQSKIDGADGVEPENPAGPRIVDEGGDKE